MQLNKAFEKEGKLKNLGRFKKAALDYMIDATAQYGSPVDLNLPMGDFVVLNDPEQFGEVFKNERDHYEKSKGYKDIALILGNGLLTAEGEDWHRQRKALQPSFHKNELRKLLPAVWNTGEEYIQSLGSNTTLRLDTEMSGLTMIILLNSLIKYQSQDLAEKMSQHIMFGQEFIVNRIRSPFKWPVWIPVKDNREYHKMMKDANDLIQQCVDDRRAMKEQEVNDLLQVLMTFYDPEEQFIEIRSQLLTFLVAGHETSAIAMTWTLHLLAHHQDIQEKVYQEIAEVDKLEDIDLMNFSGLDYTQRVIKESLRYYPPIWNIVRRAVKEDEVGGYHIPIGKQLMLNIYLMHHNEQYWSDPKTFNPDRFKKELSSQRHNFQYLPFGGGGRFCIGNNFALYEILILTIQFVKKYKIKPKTERHPGFNPLLTLRPAKAVEVLLEER